MDLDEQLSSQLLINIECTFFCKEKLKNRAKIASKKKKTNISQLATKAMGGALGSGRPTVDYNDPRVKFVVESIHKDKVVIFSKTHCPYCLAAKETLHKANCPYFAVELDKRDDGGEIQDVLFALTGVRTVPRIFIDGKCVGGADDLKKLFESGKLKSLLENK